MTTALGSRANGRAAADPPALRLDDERLRAARARGRSPLRGRTGRRGRGAAVRDEGRPLPAPGRLAPLRLPPAGHVASSTGRPASLQPFSPASIAATFAKPISWSVAAAKRLRALGAFVQ